MDDSVRAELDSLQVNDEQLAGRVRELEKMLDTKRSPVWKRALYQLDGWPPWHTVVREPAWRPWREWFRS